MRRRVYDLQAFFVLGFVLLLLPLGGYGIYRLVQAGIRERDAEPPRVVVDRERKVEQRRRCSTDADGYERCRWVTDEYHYLYSAEGYSCQVTAREYRVVQLGQRHKCMQLFGWSE